jgi:hypothetical protein
MRLRTKICVRINLLVHMVTLRRFIMADSELYVVSFRLTIYSRLQVPR